MSRRLFSSGPFLASLMAADVIHRAQQQPAPAPEPQVLQVTDEEAEAIMRRQRILAPQPESRQVRRDRERREAKAVASHMKATERKFRR